jgi:hypothetical protein
LAKETILRIEQFVIAALGEILGVNPSAFARMF